MGIRPLLQNGMKDMLELEHQLQHIDYHKDNFVHADMSPRPSRNRWRIAAKACGP